MARLCKPGSAGVSGQVSGPHLVAVYLLESTLQTSSSLGPDKAGEPRSAPLWPHGEDTGAVASPPASTRGIGGVDTLGGSLGAGAEGTREGLGWT